MVAQLTDESIRIAVKGVDGRSRGLVGCSFALRPGSYDHKRHHQMGGKNKDSPKLPIWDFVLRRDDGSALRLHPQWSTNKVETYPAEGHTVPVEPPARGLGASDGKGTFKAFKVIGTQAMLKFDGLKNQTYRQHIGGRAQASSSSTA